MAPQAATEHYRQQQQIALATVAAARQAWRAMTPDFDVSWMGVGQRLLRLLTAAQVASVRSATDYVPRLLGELDIDAASVARVFPQGLAGVASDGRPLDSLLYQSVVTSKRAVADGATTPQALRHGREFLDRAVRTQVADAGRVATGVETAIRPQLQGHVRYLSPPSCSRCTVLAGRFYRWSDGFLRHDRRDCVMVPSTQEAATGLISDPMQAFREGRITDLTQAQRDAINDGADISRVVNATTRKGAVYTAGGVKFTRDATTRRGTGRRTRLTPEAIYDFASDRDHVIRLLRVHGYIL